MVTFGWNYKPTSLNYCIIFKINLPKSSAKVNSHFNVWLPTWHLPLVLLFKLSPPISGKTVFPGFLSTTIKLLFVSFYFLLSSFSGWMNKSWEELCCVWAVFCELIFLFPPPTSCISGRKRKPATYFCFRFWQFDVIFAGNVNLYKFHGKYI